MTQLSPDDGFPARLFCVSLARLFMLFLGLLGVLFRTSAPAILPVQSSAVVAESGGEGQQLLTVRTKAGDSLAGLLVRHGLKLPSAEDLSRKLRPFIDVRTLPVGQQVDLVVDPNDDSVSAFEMIVRKRVVRADATAHGWSIDQWPLAVTSRLVVVRGTVADDFRRSARRSGLTAEHVAQIQKIFAADLDVLHESQRGDAFAVVVTERFYPDGQRLERPIAAATLRIAGDYYSAFAHRDASGEAHYFDIKGARLPRRFLATPVKYDRISSTFELARPDPMTGKIRPHEAIDYVAAQGTPVVTVAEGMIEFAGRQAGYGKLVEINHGEGYLSSYGHLSSFGAKIKVGKSVKAGDLIGYVGDTGYSTGPHLHFEFSRYGKKLDYLTARIPAGESLSGAELRRFQSARDEKLLALRDGNWQISQLSNLTFY